MTPQAIEDLRSQIRAYCDDSDPRSLLNIGTLTLTKLKETFRLFKEYVVECKSHGPTAAGGPVSAEKEELLKHIQDLKACLLQRDNEIAILVNMVKKGKTANDVMTAVVATTPQERGAARDGRKTLLAAEEEKEREEEVSAKRRGEQAVTKEETHSKRTVAALPPQVMNKEEKMIQKFLFGIPPPDDRRLLESASGAPSLSRHHTRLIRAVPYRCL